MALMWLATSWVSASTILLIRLWMVSFPVALSSLGRLVLASSLDLGRPDARSNSISCKSTPPPWHLKLSAQYLACCSDPSPIDFRSHQNRFHNPHDHGRVARLVPGRNKIAPINRMRSRRDPFEMWGEMIGFDQGMAGQESCPRHIWRRAIATDEGASCGKRSPCVAALGQQGAVQTRTLLLASTSISASEYPSISPSTSFVCCPIEGAAVSMRSGVAEKTIGARLYRLLPTSG